MCDCCCLSTVSLSCTISVQLHEVLLKYRDGLSREDGMFTVLSVSAGVGLRSELLFCGFCSDDRLSDSKALYFIALAIAL